MARNLRPHRLLASALLWALVVAADLTFTLGTPKRRPRWRAWLAQRQSPLGGGPPALQRLHLEVTPVSSVAALGPLLAMLRQQPGVQGVEFAQLAAGTALLRVRATEMTHLAAALLRLRGGAFARLTLLDTHRLRLTMLAADARRAA